MNWFKSMWLTSEERQILKDAKKKKQEFIKTLETAKPEPIFIGQEKTLSVAPTKPYSKIIYSNSKYLTVIFKDESILSKSDVDRETFDLVKLGETQQQIEDLLLGSTKFVEYQHIIETEQERQIVKDNLSIFRDHPDFEINGEDVFMKGVKLSIPAPVIFSFIEILEKLEGLDQAVVEDLPNYESLEEQYHALKMFWLKLALNSIDQSRKDLLVFVKKNNVRITPNGNLVLYRRVVSRSIDKTLTTFISQKYYEIKKIKKGPANYNIFRDAEGTLICTTKDDISGNLIGNLKELYTNLDQVEDNKFVSSNSGKNGQLPIQVGKIYSIPEDEINLNNGICAAGGLHAAAVDYNYSSFGDTPVVVLVNPSKAITVPMGETGKLRTTEMFIACVNDKKQGVHFDEDVLAAFDEEYHDLTIKELEEVVSKKDFSKISVKENKPAVDMIDLEKIKELLKNRVKTVV